jgi:hypothetical protein
MRRRAAARRDVHVDKGVFAVGVVARDQDRVGIPDEAKVEKALVFIWTSDCQASLRVVEW